MIEIVVAVFLCAVIITCTIGPSLIIYLHKEPKYISGPMTEEGVNEWLDESLKQFQNWEEDQREPILLRSEQRKHLET